jgi:uncharacterized protein (TIGR01777 family)
MATARIVLLGGSGLIGRALLDHWQGRGHELVVLSRRPGRVSGLPPGVQVVAWQPADAARLTPLVDGAAAVVNLAGGGIADRRWTAARKRALRASRVETGAALTAAVAAAAVPPAVLLQASAVGYYGAHGDESLSESDPPGADFLGRLCVEWESSTAGVEAYGVRRVLLRTGIVLAREGGALPQMAMPFRLFLGGPVGSGRQWLSWIHLDDEVAAIDFLWRCPDATGAFDLTAPEPLTNCEFGRILGGVLRRPSLLPVPAFSLRLLFGEMAGVLLDGQRVLPQRLRALGFTFRFPDARSALADLFGQAPRA